MALKVRTLTTEEAHELKRLAGSRTAPHRVVQRAQLVWASAHGETVPALARQVGLSAFRVRAWLHRLHRHGLAGLADAPRAGRPRRHDETGRGRVIALAHPTPQSLGLSLALGTLARLQQVLPERHGRGGTPATIGTWRQAEGWVWQRPQSGFQGQGAAAFGETRGPASGPTRRRARPAGSSAARSRAR